MSLTNVRVRQEGGSVVVLKDGRSVFDMPWGAALELAKALQDRGKLAEEWAKRERIIVDQGILTRMGLLIGLLRNPRLRPLAMKEALHNPLLRRNIKDRIDQRHGVVGTPTVTVQGAAHG